VADATCLDGCAGAAASGRTACRADFTDCTASCGAASAASTVGTSPVEIIPPGAVVASPGQTVYLTYILVNHGPTMTLRYVPSFVVASGAATVRSVSGLPSSSGQTLSHNARKYLKVGVRVNSGAAGGVIDIVGVFAFTAPETVTVRVPGAITVHGLP